MKTLFLLLTPLMVLLSNSLLSQSNACSELTITGIQPDSITPNTSQIGIAFSGPEIEFINYPFIESVIDCNGDTVASGSMFWFGQFGQTTQEYPITYSGTGICLPFTIVFTYLDNSGNSISCELSYDLADVVLTSKITTKVFPNPTTNEILLTTENKFIGHDYSIVDISGKCVMNGTIDSVNTSIKLNEINKGVYFIKISDTSSEAIKLIKE